MCTLPALWPFFAAGGGGGESEGPAEVGRGGRGVGADAAEKGRCPRESPHVTPPAAVREGAGTGAQPLRRGEFKHAEEGAKLTALFT